MSRSVALAGLLAGCVAMTGPGCATIVSGTSQQIKINSDPAGATAEVDGTTLTTPGSIVLKREKSYVIVISKPGYEEKKVRLNSEMNPWVWGNVPFLSIGLIGLAVDYSTKAANRLTPTPVNVTLNKLPEAATAPLPSAKSQPQTEAPGGASNSSESGQSR